MVLILACLLEMVVAIVFTFTLLYMAANSLGTSSLGRSELSRLSVAALVLLPLAAVLSGALPAILKAGSWKRRLRAVGVSILLCLGALIVYWPLLLVTGGFSVGFASDTLAWWITSIISAIPFVVVPLLVEWWTER